MSANASLVALTALRLLLAYLPLSDWLQSDHLLSSPLTSYARLKEGIFLHGSGIDSYSGGTFRHSPIQLALFSTVLPITKITAPLIWTITDSLGAWALADIWKSRSRGTEQGSSRELLVILTYLFNPYLFLPSLAYSTSSIDNAVLLLSLSYACRGKRPLALLLLALASHFTLTSCLLLVPWSLLLLIGPESHLKRPAEIAVWKALPSFIVEYAGCVAGLFGISSLIAGGMSWVEPTWGAQLLLPDLTPNSGLWWYFFTEMFDHFRPFFLVAFTANMVIYVAPITIKFQHDPLYAGFLLIGVIGMFKSYQTLSDPGLFLSMISLFPEIYEHLNNPIVTALLHLHASLLLPLFNRLWLAQGTGNANFFYASTLVFGLANGFAVTDCLWAGLMTAVGKAQEDWAVVQVYDVDDKVKKGEEMENKTQ